MSKNKKKTKIISDPVLLTGYKSVDIIQKASESSSISFNSIKYIGSRYGVLFVWIIIDVLEE